MITVVKNILNIATLIVFLQSGSFLEKSSIQNKQGEYFFLTLTTLLGMYLMISSGHFLLFYIGLEMASIPLATLIAMDKSCSKSAEAGGKFILLSAFSTGIMLFGISYLYGSTGTLYFADISHLLFSGPLQIMAMVFFVAGLFFKISLVPFHMWAADVYEGAPTPITSYLSVVSKGAAVFALMALLYKVFGNLTEQWQSILYWLIIITITIGNLFALRQTNIKRFLAFSSIAQAGYLVLGVLAGTAYGMATVVFYLLVYLFSNLAAFGVAGVVEKQSGTLELSAYKGFYATNPKLSFVMMLAMFSLAGIAPFAGFFSKLFVFSAAADEGYYLLVLIAALNVIIGLYYYLRVVKAMFIDKGVEPVPAFSTDGWHRISLIICTVGVLLTGVISALFHVIEKFSFGI